jgi:hypothetical protein
LSRIVSGTSIRSDGVQNAIGIGEVVKRVWVQDVTNDGPETKLLEPRDGFRVASGYPDGVTGIKPSTPDTLAQVAAAKDELDHWG